MNTTVKYECIESLTLSIHYKYLGESTRDIEKGTTFFIECFDNDVVVLSDGTRINYLVFKDYFRKV